MPITVNKNSIPNDPEQPFVTSGILVVGRPRPPRAASPPRTTTEAGQLDRAHPVFHADDEAALADIRSKVDVLLAAHPLYPDLDY